MFYFSKYSQIVCESCHCCTNSPERIFFLLNKSSVYCVIILFIYISQIINVLLNFIGQSYILRICFQCSCLCCMWLVFSILICRNILCILDMSPLLFICVENIFLTPRLNILLTFYMFCCKLIFNFTAVQLNHLFIFFCILFIQNHIYSSLFSSKIFVM